MTYALARRARVTHVVAFAVALSGLVGCSGHDDAAAARQEVLEFTSHLEANGVGAIAEPCPDLDGVVSNGEPALSCWSVADVTDLPELARATTGWIGSSARDGANPEAWCDPSPRPATSSGYLSCSVLMPLESTAGYVLIATVVPTGQPGPGSPATVRIWLGYMDAGFAENIQTTQEHVA